MTTLTFRVFGAEGHRQRESFYQSVKYDWTNDENGTRIVEVLNSDITGTNEYSEIRITRDTADLCLQELQGQITDGIFEGYRVGKVLTVEHIDGEAVLKQIEVEI